MASAKKKLDEYHLKILRQFLSLPANKECFDCHQRGPTYVNVTIGSFVCTTCSGMLRGLTPPHRVKSISMATFTPEEIDFVKARGNDYCRRTWLGLLDAERPSKDEQQIKDFMIAKYERKRYYVDPSIASTLSKAVNGDVQTQPKPCFPRVAQPHPATLAFKPPSKTIGNSSAFTPEPFADFSKLSIPPPCDPFNSSQAAAAPSSSLLAFADFDNNPVFSNSTSSASLDMWAELLSLAPALLGPTAPSCPPTNRWSVPGVGEAGTVPGEDRYAALKDLDCLMKSQQQAPEPTADWNTGVANGSSAWPASTHSNSATVNPFKGGGMWGAGANPFRTEAKLVSAESVWPQVSNGQVSNGFPTSQSLNFAAPKVPWNNDSISNPFVVGTSPHTMSHHSSNPFL